MSWFNEVAHGGISEFERQSWRDIYNDGRAAGDLTGATNARLDAERDAFQGATWGGSSTRYSALELARLHDGVGAGAASVGVGSPRSSGPGNEATATGPVQPGKAPGGAGAGSRLTFSGPLAVEVKEEATGMLLGGPWFQPNPWWSNTDQWEERHGEPGDWIGGFVTMGADAVFNAARAVDAVTGTRIVDPSRKSGSLLDDASKRPGAWPEVWGSLVDFDTRVSRQLNEWFTPDRPFVGGRF